MAIRPGKLHFMIQGPSVGTEMSLESKRRLAVSVRILAAEIMLQLVITLAAAAIFDWIGANGDILSYLRSWGRVDLFAVVPAILAAVSFDALWRNRAICIPALASLLGWLEALALNIHSVNIVWALKSLVGTVLFIGLPLAIAVKLSCMLVAWGSRRT